MSFKDELERYQKNVARADALETVSLPQLFPDAFMRAHTQFQSLKQMTDAYPAVTPDDLTKVASAGWNAFVNEKTSFGSWQEMEVAAIAARINRMK